jgi:hypothetical protein
MGSI